MRSRSIHNPVLLVLLAVAVLFASAPAMGADDLPTDSPFIIGGEKADPGDWPFIAALVNPAASNVYQGQFCGGALIAPTLVLTAAHCVDTSDPSDVSVVTGITDLATTPKSELIAVTEIFVHPDWGGPGPSVGPNDLAMLRLATNAPTAPVGPADPASAASLWPAGTLATAIGWGATNVNPIEYPTQLQELSIEIVGDTDCSIYLGGLFDPVSNLCAGQPGSTEDGLCFGDSGGPVVVPDGGAGWLLVGLTSWGGDPCAATGKPDVFTEVANFTEWIAGFFSVTRFAGSDRYSTAAIVSQKSFVAPVPVAYVATGLDFPDALAASAAAGARGGPVLLTDPNVLPTATKNELARLDPAEIVLVGGSGVVSAAVFAELAKFAPEVTRSSGGDRFTTAEAVSIGAFESADVVYVATGFDFPDALSAGAAGGFEGGPILLTAFDDLPTATRREIKRLKPSEIIVVGGSSVIADSVVDELAKIAPTVRVSGADRYATAAAVSARVHAKNQAVVFIATGLNFPDALAAAATAAAVGAPILLTGDLALPSATKKELGRLSPVEIVVVGGSSAVSQSVMAELTSFTD